MSDLSSRLEGIRARIATAAAKAGRSADQVELVAVSKNHDAEAVREAWEAGQGVFGENRVQELITKAPLLPAATRWHFIGHLQSNKVRKLLPLCELIHGIDSLDLARQVDRIAGELGAFPRILLEVNVSGEASKHGFQPETLKEELETLLTLQRVQVEGLMTIAPFAEDPETARPVFARLREYRDELAALGGTPLPILSMGMSGDYEIAIEEGATIVRIGTAIFGERARAR